MELAKFIHETEKGFAKKVKEGDYALLVEIMGHLMAIRERQSTDNIFKHLKSMADLLQSYGQQLPEQIYTELEVKIQLVVYPLMFSYSKINFLYISFFFEIFFSGDPFAYIPN